MKIHMLQTTPGSDGSHAKLFLGGKDYSISDRLAGLFIQSGKAVALIDGKKMLPGQYDNKMSTVNEANKMKEGADSGKEQGLKQEVKRRN